MARLHTLDLSRRNLLRGATVIAGVTALIGAGLAASPAVAGTKFAQSMAKYQPSPKNGQSCATCTQFQPADSCKVVDGKVSASGWCLLYARKS